MRRLVGVLLVLISAVSFGAMPILARLAYAAGATPVTLLFLRFGTASLVMLALAVVRRTRLPRGKLLASLIALGGVCYVGQSLTYFTALSLASASLVGLLLYLYPVLVAVFAALLLKERLTLARWSALLLALAGAALTIGPSEGGKPLGIALGLAAAVIYASYVVAGGQVMRRVPAIPASTVIISAAAVVYGGLVAVDGLSLPANWQGWLAILCLSLVSTVLAIVTFMAGLERVGPTVTAMVSTAEPASTVVLAALVLRERVGGLTLLGGALILAAVFIVSVGERAPRATVGAACEPPLPTHYER